MEDKVLFVTESYYWSQIQAVAQNGIVQILSQGGQFNWIEPYKIGEQFDGRGSGFFISAHGHIVTTAHVINQARQVIVHVPALGRIPLHVDVISFFPDRDLALLKVKDHDLDFMRAQLGTVTFFALGDSDKLQRTENVLVLGYPLGQSRLKSTTGVISGRESMYGYSLLQITAPMNPGNSGGPLLNLRGEVIGIAISTIMHTQNIGYAIPANELAMVLDTMYSTLFVRRPFLGARFVAASDEKARLLKNPLPCGLYISTVFKNSVLAQADVRDGDMLYEFNDFVLDAYGDAYVPWSLDKVSLFELAARIPIGDTVFLTLYRAGKKIEKKCTFALTEPFAIRVMYPGYETIDYEMIGGMVFMELTVNHLLYLSRNAPDLLHYRHLENQTDSVLIVTHVLPGSYAYQLNILVPGDIINEINNNKVNTITQLRQAILKGRETNLLTLKTALDILVSFSLDRLLDDEEMLSRDFSYHVTPFIMQLREHSNS